MDTESLIQGSEEWRNARIGSLGASRIHDAIARTRSGWGASRANLMAELVAERLAGVPAETYINATMQRGIDIEPQARAAYAFFTDADVQEVGLVRHPSITGTHASPDGLIGADGLLEIKCPSITTHIDTLLTEKIPDKYIVQMQWQMACSGRKWSDYVSFDPRLPQKLCLYIKRIKRDDNRIKELEGLVREFLKETADKVAALEARAREEAA